MVKMKAALQKISITPDPPWVNALRAQTEHLRARIFCSPLMVDAQRGTLASECGRRWFIQLYPFIRTFPQWLALILTKAADEDSRNFLIDNIRVEKTHARQWALMCKAAGISDNQMEDIEVLPEVEALTHWLWSVNYRGDLPTCIGATNFALEGIAHELALFGLEHFPKYAGRQDVVINEDLLLWVRNHAKYDDDHPRIALEIIKKHAMSPSSQKEVGFAVRRSLEYLHLAFEACYEF